MQKPYSISGHGVSSLRGGSHLVLSQCPCPTILPFLWGSLQCLGSSARWLSPSLGLTPNCCLEKPQMSWLRWEVKQEARVAHSPGKWETRSSECKWAVSKHR